ncbi:T9SS C-terminal target domain-containing protein, partial [bacterium]
FFGGDPIEHAPRLENIHVSAWVRGSAQDQSLYFDNGANAKAQILFQNHNIRVTWGIQGIPFDITQFTIYPLPDSAFVFFECPVQISGTVHSTIIFGAAGDIGLEDDILYAGTDSTSGEVAADETAKLVLVSEGNIKILNTPANGWNNMAAGRDIIINALLITLDSDSGHFTFDQQNDTWDTTYTGPSPDQRGIIRLTGGVYQKFRGYVHRSNNGGTGYLKDYDYDQRLRYWNLPIFLHPDHAVVPEVLDFDTLLIDSTATDSVRLVLTDRALIDIPLDSTGVFTTSERLYVFDSTLYVPVIFAPTANGTFSEEILVYIEGNRYAIPVQGVCGEIEDASGDAVLQPSTFRLSAYPNPFNPVTTIQFSLIKNESVTLSIYNTSGQLVETLLDEVYGAGEHRVQFEGTALPSGLYFARLQSSKHTAVQKLLLLK